MRSLFTRPKVSKVYPEVNSMKCDFLNFVRVAIDKRILFNTFFKIKIFAQLSMYGDYHTTCLKTLHQLAHNYASEMVYEQLLCFTVRLNGLARYLLRSSMITSSNDYTLKNQIKETFQMQHVSLRVKYSQFFSS